MKKLIDCANGKISADLVLKQANIFNAFTLEWIKADLAICDGIIAGWGNYTGIEEIDCRDKYITPGFIDTHVHIESSMLSPDEFVRAILPAGTTSAICDPHEIANVGGIPAIRYVLDATAGLPFGAYIMLPSCVPASAVEGAACELLAHDLEPLLRHPRVLGLGEFMNYPGVQNADSDVIDKLQLAKDAIIDGHAPNQSGKALNAYLCGGIRTEHECTSPQEALEKISKGMYLQIREGTLCRNLLDLLPAVTSATLRRCLFCTDDRSPKHITERGHINDIVASAVAAGLPATWAITIATLNAAECYGLKNTGAIAPGYDADLLIFDDLRSFKPQIVFKNGAMVAKDGELTVHIAAQPAPLSLTSSLHATPPDAQALRIPATRTAARVIQLVAHQALTREVCLDLPIADGAFQPDVRQDVAKVVVVERHKASGKSAAAFLQGLGLERGAIAQTIAHDAHNIVAIGANDADIICAINELIEQRGGIVVVDKEAVVARVPLVIGGLMSKNNLATVTRQSQSAYEAAYMLGVRRAYNPFLSLAFISLSVIPDLKLTVNGLFDVRSFKLI